MAVKSDGQFSFVEALMPVARGSRLDRLSALVKWYRFEKVLARLRRAGGPGRPAYPALLMFKALLLLSLYGLSDSELEEALADRLSFRRFVGLALDEAVPDHTTLNRFRNLLVEEGTLEKLFGELDRQLDQAGLILRRGTMLDATVIETAAARPPRGMARRSDDGAVDGLAADAAPLPTDPDAGFTRRSGRPGFSYGYKAHVGVDQGSGLIRRVRTTAANVNDTVEADHLICGDEAAVLGDAAYHTRSRELELKERGIKPRLMRRPNRHHPKLPPRLKRFNRLIAGQRFAVETTFATWKNRMGLGVIRYRVLARAAGQVLLGAIAFNMRRWVTLAG